MFHPIVERYGAIDPLPSTWDFWKEYLESMIPRCDVLMVAKMEGWMLSGGIKAEVECAQRHNIPVEYLEV